MRDTILGPLFFQDSQLFHIFCDNAADLDRKPTPDLRPTGGGGGGVRDRNPPRTYDRRGGGGGALCSRIVCI